MVSAPTGCGKTVVLEMAIIRLLTEQRGNDAGRKIVYSKPSIIAQTNPRLFMISQIVAPLKALCAERCADWKSKFDPLVY